MVREEKKVHQGGRVWHPQYFLSLAYTFDPWKFQTENFLINHTRCGDESRTTRPLYLHLSFEHVWLRVHMPHDASQNKAFVSVMMNNLNQKHHHTTTITCVCLVYNTQTQSLSDPGWQSLQASNTWHQLDVMPSTITPELIFECIHPWKLPNKAWWQAMLTPSFFFATDILIASNI